MNRVFLDTSGLIALVNTDDQWHAQAVDVWRRLVQSGAALTTTSLVLIELADGLSRVHQRGLAIRLVTALRDAASVEIFQVDLALEEQAWRLFRERSDKDWGMTDCVSMSVMSNHGIQAAFTADHHFKQAGFDILLES